MGSKARPCWTELLAFLGVKNQSEILIFGSDWLFSDFLEPWYIHFLGSSSAENAFNSAIRFAGLLFVASTLGLCRSDDVDLIRVSLFTKTPG